MDDFGFHRLGRTFDFALAQSLFTHLEMNLVQRCLVNADRVPAPGGRLYATFFENPLGQTHLDPIFRDGGTFATFYDRDSFHYAVDAFRWMVSELDMDLHYIGDWNHPRGQYMLRFDKPAGQSSYLFP